MKDLLESEEEAPDGFSLTSLRRILKPPPPQGIQEISFPSLKNKRASLGGTAWGPPSYVALG